jgi:tetratricopeptide (TPR) repeat protein
MAIYYRESGLTWKQYLLANAFVGDITDSVKRNGRELAATISDQTRSMIASNESLNKSLTRSFEYRVDQVSGEIAQLSSEVIQLSDGITGLHSAFTYNMGLILDQLQIQQKILESILQQLDTIHETLKHPLLTQARELSQIGMDRISKGLLQEGLEALLESAEKNKADFLVQLQIGKLYLYGKNITDDVINLPLAKEHLLLAARYANSEIKSLSGAAKFCAESFLHAAISCYSQANEYWIEGKADLAKKSTEEALILAQKATQMYPKMAESFYNHAKFAALLGDRQTAIKSLYTAIQADHNYCLKVDVDKDFDGIREYLPSIPSIRMLFEYLREKSKEEATKALSSAKKLLED